ncbi:MAG TPA: T9SS type A sorting domain-containing protein [Chitinophaga sp.]|uniref:T9SS type A sorting domain-containing protein n=1 Tax=Chitinophaga sp. TaxID=1869181 RepID=UPI002C7BA4E4|nr:T9SS type A sorting domain-containing protein [Chitinophaga sp.]HVI48158.1 T9SS type A sorting domain-containing protein [Chitinophaga sp.]
MRSSTPKCLLVLSVLIFLCTAASAQLILNRQVMASGGGSGTLSNARIQYTIGEPVITTITDGRTLLTQGFQQPEELPKLPPGVNPVKGYIIFPNPAATSTKIQFDLLSDAAVTIEVINTAGQTLFSQYKQMGAGKTVVVLPVNHFAAGIYTIMLKVNYFVFFEKLIVQ